MSGRPFHINHDKGADHEEEDEQWVAERGCVRAEAGGPEEAGRVEGAHDDEVEGPAQWAFVGAAGEVDKWDKWERCLRRNAGRHGETRAVRFASQFRNADKRKGKKTMNAVFKMMLAEDRRVERSEREVSRWHEKRERRERDERIREVRRLGEGMVALAFAKAMSKARGK